MNMRQLVPLIVIKVQADDDAGVPLLKRWVSLYCGWSNMGGLWVCGKQWINSRALPVLRGAAVHGCTGQPGAKKPCPKARL